jgi:hypothetical protein
MRALSGGGWRSDGGENQWRRRGLGFPAAHGEMVARARVAWVGTLGAAGDLNSLGKDLGVRATRPRRAPVGLGGGGRVRAEDGAR